MWVGKWKRHKLGLTFVLLLSGILSSSNRQNGYWESINFYFTYLFFYIHSNRFSIWIEYYFLLFLFSLQSLTLPLHLTQAKPRHNWWPLLLPMLTFTLSFISHSSLSLLHSISHSHKNSFRFQCFLFLLSIFFHLLLILFFFHLFYVNGYIIVRGFRWDPLVRIARIPIKLSKSSQEGEGEGEGEGDKKWSTCLLWLKKSLYALLSIILVGIYHQEKR